MTRQFPLLCPAERDLHAVLAGHRHPAACVHKPSGAPAIRAEAEELHGRRNAARRRHGCGWCRIRQGSPCSEAPTVDGFGRWG
ncbi:hypothetical protein [Kitasatospora sp. NPDC096204]|uniref:hypothetical protein n=1 Tax=Kitasatospora sp. NPDC096204 TaxID=3364094 RepID=UPI003812976E